jgi:hypothetical protein
MVSRTGSGRSRTSSTCHSCDATLGVWSNAMSLRFVPSERIFRRGSRASQPGGMSNTHVAGPHPSPKMQPCWQISPAGHVPQLPPQPSKGPHVLDPQFGVQHVPAVQVSPTEQVPQLPPQPSSPHVLPEQFGVQHVPNL